MFLGLPEAAESEGFDRSTLDMPAKQIALLEQVAAANQNVVVVLVQRFRGLPWPRGQAPKGASSNLAAQPVRWPALADVIFGQVSLRPASSPSPFRWTSTMTRA